MSNENEQIGEAEAAVMQHAAATNNSGAPMITQAPVHLGAAAAAASAADEEEAVVVPAKTPTSEIDAMFPQEFSTVTVNLMFTLGLTDLRFGDGMVQPLAKFNHDGASHNLYNPFRKGSKPNEPEVAPGILRSALRPSLEAAALLNNSALVFLGSEGETLSALRSAVGSIADTCTRAVGINPMQIVGQFKESDDEPDTPENTLRFGDIIRITSWAAADRSEAASVTSYEGIINFFVNSGALYDSKDKIKTIRQIESIIKQNAKRVLSEADDVPMVIAINMSTADFADQGVRDLIGALMEQDGYALYTKASIIQNYEDLAFAPKTAVGVSGLLFNPNAPQGDLLLLKSIEMEEEAAEQQ